MTITESDIEYAERILLPAGKEFGDQARAFIKRLDTLDLQAVPGSGKTTVLLAKLLIFEKHLPFEDGAGVLVISHTNTAVDEIKNRIGRYCPMLMPYPNFVGTIQRFVNRFLAIPYYKQIYNNTPRRIDNELYFCNQKLPAKVWGWLNNRPEKQKKEIRFKTRLLNKGTLGYDLSKDGGDFPLNKGGEAYTALLEMKKSLREDGFLCFDDSYILGKAYLDECLNVKLLLQKRFKYVFVDEMQDMDEHQKDLLERLFYDNGNNSTVYQRIGDNNQAIYFNKVKAENTWNAREVIHSLTGSRRLPKAIAEVVQPFALEEQAIEGKNNFNVDGSANDILPHVIVFDNNTVEKVIPVFCELVKKFQECRKIPVNHKHTINKHTINAVAWIGKEGATFGLRNYWKDYDSKTVQENEKALPQPGGLKKYYRGLVDILLKVLRLEEITNPQIQKHFTANSLKKHLREVNEEYYDRIRFLLYKWSREIYKGNHDEAMHEMKEKISKILKAFFSKDLDKATDFVSSDFDSFKGVKDVLIKNNVYRCTDSCVEVKVGTVHSVKGETHTATLYMESYYYNDSGKSYESQRLKKQFEGEKLAENAGARVKESAKMLYVGFSRPTHLLCFAVQKSRYDPEVFASWEPIIL